MLREVNFPPKPHPRRCVKEENKPKPIVPSNTPPCLSWIRDTKSQLRLNVPYPFHAGVIFRIIFCKWGCLPRSDRLSDLLLELPDI
jgi:hypothetical protein